jgi:pyruvate dehydrogenase E1 component alpha subunit
MTTLVGTDPYPRVAVPEADDLAALLLIRHFEEALLRLFSQGKLNGTTHTCLGQEYVPVALAPLLRPDDFVFSNHRGHGHYLARFRDPEGLLAEITGRAGAVCSGVGGSQHIYRDTYLSTGVQGESLPVAVGVALRFQRTGEPRIAVTHIGDGTWGEGVVYESLNLAAIWNLPLVVVVENNGIAQTTPTTATMAGTIAGRAAAFDVGHTLITGCDVSAIRERLRPVIEDARRHRKPVVVEFDTDRVGPHSKGDDTRDATDIHRAKAHDWYLAYQRAASVMFEEADRAQRSRISDVVADVLGRPESTWRSAGDGTRGR